MVPTANNHTPTPEPTGDLEQLFRQKLGEAEVTPRMNLWEQIDHELLVQQNETFRRRLVWHRWLAAASILLTLGVGSWFTFKPDSAAELATLTTTGAFTTQPSSVAPGRSRAAGLSASEAGVAAATLSSSALSVGSLQPATTQPQQDLVALAQQPARATRPTQASRPEAAATFASATSAAEYTRANGGYEQPVRSSFLDASFGGGSAPAGSVSAYYSALHQDARPAYSRTPASGASWLSALSSHAATAFAGLLPTTRPDTLKPVLASPPMLAQAAETTPEKEAAPLPSRPKRWRLMGSYSAGAYNPNMTFASAGSAVASAPSATGVSSYRASNLYDQAATEHRQNLRPGFAQRVALTVSYAVSKHWTVSTGVQVAEQQASSQTSYNFLDGKMPMMEVSLATADKYNSLSPPKPQPLRTAQYRYRTGGVPVSVRYGSAKNGVSLYAKVGAAVNVLFNSRSELIGVPEATTTYSLGSAGSPYRTVQGSVNGGAGVRYKPAAASWSVALGPMAEAGLTTLNTNAAPASTQARPYAIGMEASVEFGNKAAVVAH